MKEQKQDKLAIQSIQSLPSMQLRQKQLQIFKRIHSKYFTDISFIEIDYIIGEPLPGMIKQSQSIEQALVFVSDLCLIITENAFNLLYTFLLQLVIQKLCSDFQIKNSAAELLLTMNGQNQKAYNFKKNIIKRLFQGNCQEIDFDLKRQLKLNQAIIMKNKKSSACYEYRFKILQLQFKIMKTEKNTTKEELLQIHHSQHLFTKRVLDRYFRNYFCWTYRLRFFKLLIEFDNNEKYFTCQINYVFEILERNPNDYSALSYMRYLVRQCQIFSYKQALQNLLRKCSQLNEFCKLAYDSTQQYLSFIGFLSELKVNE